MRTSCGEERFTQKNDCAQSTKQKKREETNQYELDCEHTTTHGDVPLNILTLHFGTRADDAEKPPRRQRRTPQTPRLTSPTHSMQDKVKKEEEDENTAQCTEMYPVNSTIANTINHHNAWHPRRHERRRPIQLARLQQKKLTHKSTQARTP